MTGATLTNTTPERRSFGSVFRLRNGRFEARYRHDGRAYKRRFNTQRQAEQYLSRQEVRLDDGTWAKPTVHRTTFEEGTAMVVADYEMNDRRSVDRLEQAIEHLRPTFAGMRLGAITADRIVDFVNLRRSEGAAAATVQKEVAALRRAFRLAVAVGKLTASQVPTFPRLVIHNARTGFLNGAEVEGLLTHLSDDVSALLRFMAVTGWRKSEAQALTWDRVDWEGGVVRLDVGRTKNKEGRLFPFTGFPDLDALLRRRREATDVAQRQTGRIIRHVFHRGGRPIRDFRVQWQRACKKAGLDGTIPHDLRRSAVRNLVRAGVPEKTAMQLTGHKTRAIFDRYDIVDEQDLRDGVEKLAMYAARLVERDGPKVLSMT